MVGGGKAKRGGQTHAAIKEKALNNRIVDQGNHGLTKRVRLGRKKHSDKGVVGGSRPLKTSFPGVVDACISRVPQRADVGKAHRKGSDGPQKKSVESAIDSDRTKDSGLEAPQAAGGLIVRSQGRPASYL